MTERTPSHSTVPERYSPHALLWLFGVSEDSFFRIFIIKIAMVIKQKPIISIARMRSFRKKAPNRQGMTSEKETIVEVIPIGPSAIARKPQKQEPTKSKP